MKWIHIILVISINRSQIVDARKYTIRKCCPTNMLLSYEKLECIPYDGIGKFEDVMVSSELGTETGQSASAVFNFEEDPDFEHHQRENRTFMRSPFRFKGVNVVYLYEDGSIDLRTTEQLDKLENKERVEFLHWEEKKFCIEYELHMIKGMLQTRPFIWAVILEDEEETSAKKLFLVYFQTAGFIVSAFFLLLLMMVYLLLPELRTLGGLILMSCNLSLMANFVLMAVIRITQMNNLERTNPACEILAFSAYFFTLASFFWMNIMSFDIWWTFRGFATSRPIHRRGENFKFLMYGLYALGVPALLTTCAVILNEIELQHGPMTWITTFIKNFEQNCNFNESATVYYFHIPVLMLLSGNILLFTLTGCCIRKLLRGSTMLNRTQKNKQRTHIFRFTVYIKLSMVMGLNWILEVVSAYAPEYTVFYISDAFNMMTGLFIFIIFVCKPKTWRMIRKRFTKQAATPQVNRSSKAVLFRNNSVSSSESELSSDETQYSIVCVNPQGPALSLV